VPSGRYLSGEAIEARVSKAAAAVPGGSRPAWGVVTSALALATAEGTVYRMMLRNDWGYARPTEKMRAERRAAEAKKAARAAAAAAVKAVSETAKAACDAVFGEKTWTLDEENVVLSTEQVVRLLVLADQPGAAHALRAYLDAVRVENKLFT
jgi:hypothetical protein